MSVVSFQKRLSSSEFPDLRGFSNEAESSYNIEQEISAHYFEPLSRRRLVLEFYIQASKWKEETGHLSSSIDVCMNPAYQRIIGMGPVVLPFIFRELEQEPNYWFWALKAITGVDPVPENQRGFLRKMTATWLSWARENNYL